MKKITLLTAFLIVFIGFSQENKQKIQTYLSQNTAKFALTTQDVSDWTLQAEQSSTSTKINNYRIVQNYNGVEIFDTQSNVWVKNNEVINFSNRFMKNIASKIVSTSSAMTSIQAVNSAYTNLGYPTATFTVSETLENKSILISDGVNEAPIVAKLGYLLQADKLRLAWALQFYSPDSKSYWDLKIDAANGTILYKKDLTINCSFGHKEHNNKQVVKDFSFENTFNTTKSSMLVVTPATYRVIPYNYESPNHHAFELITTIGDGLASPNGWHDANATIGGVNATLKYDYTRGNNALSQEDATGNNGIGIRAIGGPTLNFDFPYINGVSQTLQPTEYTSAATTNLFYMTNIMHDVWYQYGFDEANANFQRQNLGRGGVQTTAGDYVQGDSQDGWSQATPTLNNANFSPTNDGVLPRMQMFMWNAGAPPTNFITVNSPSIIAGPREATTNVFEGTDSIPVPTAPDGITADLVLVENGPNPPGHNSACQAPTNAAAIAGKIALIKRGGCFFNLKVFNAQEAGAIAVIVMDSIPNNPQRLSMSSTGILGITIPAVFITKEIGDEFIAEMVNGPVNVKLEVPSNLYLFADGDFDNMIISHEYGHGISNRLIGGGLAGCMTNAEQMGEGWSDWFGLMMQLKPGDTGADSRGVGTFAINQPPTGSGIRNFPYSTDMTINPLTLEDSNDAEVHNLGEPWAATLWDLTWAYIDKYGYDPNIYTGTGGNNKVMRLVIDALKLENCNGASYISSRNNIIAADQATTGGADYCLITEVFTRRGMGLNASSGSAANALDQVADFTPFPDGPNCTLSVDYFNNDDMIRVYPNPSKGQLNLRINKYTGKINIQLVDINGRVVLNNTNVDFNIEKAIDLTSIQNGVYVLKVMGDSLNYSEKVIKN